MSRARLRRAGLGLSTLLGIRPGGFLIPYRHAGAARAGPGHTALRTFTSRRAGVRPGASPGAGGTGAGGVALLGGAAARRPRANRRPTPVASGEGASKEQ
ncbi:hypothetical protein SQ03_27865, partial [Methylobacterium platani JCM 14648]